MSKKSKKPRGFRPKIRHHHRFLKEKLKKGKMVEVIAEGVLHGRRGKVVKSPNKKHQVWVRIEMSGEHGVIRFLALFMAHHLTPCRSSKFRDRKS